MIKMRGSAREIRGGRGFPLLLRVLIVVLIIAIGTGVVSGITEDPQLTTRPSIATNLVGTNHTIVATLAYPSGTPVPNEPLTFAVVSGPHAGRTEDTLTNVSGYASFSYTGVSSGTDTIQVTYTGKLSIKIVSNSSVKIWYEGPLLTAVPPTATNPVGTNHTIIATLAYPDGTPLPDEPLNFVIVSGPHAGRTEEIWTNASGSAAFTYTGTSIGTDTIEVRYFKDIPYIDLNTSSVKVWYTGAHLSVAPPSATNPVETSHTIVATLKYPDGTPLPDEPLTFTIVSGPNTGRTEDAWTNISGSAAFSYFGLNTGTDTVKVTYTGNRAVEIISNTSVKVWYTGAQLSVSPPSATNPVGTSHTIVATLKYPDGTPLPDEPLTFTIVSGPNTGRTEDAWTNISGFAAFSYIGLNTGTDTVKVTYTGNRAVEIISNTSVKIWYTGAQLSVSPPSATNPVGTSHTIVATLKYPDGTPLSDEPLTFTIVSGPNTGRTEDAWTNISGSAAFSYTGTSAGTDTVKVTYTGDRAVEIISNTSVKVWISSTDVTITNITPSSGREDGNGPLNPPVFWDPAIVGTGFQVGAVVKLQKEGETDIIGKNVVVESPGKITCIFDLTRRTPGYWDVVVINPDGSSARLPGGFYVQPTGPACIIITTIPQGARLTLDGADFGVSTRTLYGLSEGTHTITATLEGYQNWEGTFYVKYPMIKNLITIRMTKIPATTGDIAILTIPRNADVVLDGTWYGKTPLMVKAITKGSHTLSLKLGGYVPYQGTVTVTAGKTTYISKVLMPSITSIIR